MEIPVFEKGTDGSAEQSVTEAMEYASTNSHDVVDVYKRQGLSIVKRIVDLHHGIIDVVSVEDGGSQFTVKFPQERSFRCV